MSVWDAWSVCDRCAFEYRRREMRKESTGLLVCRSCYDGAYDSKRHPQNRPARSKREPTIVPDGTAPIDLTGYLVDEDGNYVLTEEGERIEVEPDVWTPRMSTYY
jgi:ribosome-binding protein aMBF1 (putative translation factor)